MSKDFELTNVNINIQNCISRAALGSEPLDALLLSNTFVPKEGWLWDYKECIKTDNLSLSKTVLQVVSFHNTCGGYLIYGVKETKKDKEFTPIELELDNFNPAQLRDKIKLYTNTIIDFTFAEVEVSFSNKPYKLGLIFIPKRPYELSPVLFVKNGPEKSPGKLVFSRDEVYFRFLDECIKASCMSDWQMLFSPRDFDASDGINTKQNTNNKLSLTHNLPDRSLICSQFIGRDIMLSKLWEWLSDDFEYTKILSGDGGKGKTSIAYEFCRSFVQAPPDGYERVIWLSVKEQQFSGITNSYYELQDSDFTNSYSFLKCLAENCALDSNEYEDLSLRVIKKNLKEGLSEFSSLIIVDDIDSLEEDEQRKVVDACRHLGAERVRFLITTRKKLAYSSDLCIDIPGLPLDDFRLFVNSLIDRYSLKNIKSKDIEKLHITCDGSPLLTSSILRIYKQGDPIDIAIKEWCSHAGEDARNAALKREIEALSHDAKRLLLTIFYFKSCSFTELKQAAGYEKIKLVDCLEELQSLFLINEPRIIESEERFSTSNTTALIISGIVEQMAFDHQKLKKDIKRMRKGTSSSKKTGNSRKVGFAINQALALLREDHFEEAMETINNELKSFKKDPDLLLMKARCLMNFPSPNFDTVIKLIRNSIESGQKKELAYELWFKSVESLDSPNGMIESATKALEQNDVDKNRWYENQAKGYILRSNVRSGDSSINDLMDASSSLTNTLKYVGKLKKEFRIQELYRLHDAIWEKLEADNDFSWLSSFDKLVQLIREGDTRSIMYHNASLCLTEARSEPNFFGKKIEAYKICTDNFYKLLNKRSDQDKIDRPFHDLLIKYS